MDTAIFKKLSLGARIASFPIFRDTRGSFSDVFTHDNTNAPLNPACMKFSISHRGVIRGVHWQTPPKSQGKWIRLVEGKVWNVFVDLQPSSPTYTFWDAVYLDSQGKNTLYLPSGLANGFQVISPKAIYLYFVDQEYAPAYEKGIRFDDPFFNFPWPLPNPILSYKDTTWPVFNKRVFI